MHADASFSAGMASDPFETLLALEDTLYSEGYQLGIEDGSQAGHREGRAFGLEKGFEKYLIMGRLHGRSDILAARLCRKAEVTTPSAEDSLVHRPSLEGLASLQPLPARSRLERHLTSVQAMVTPATLSIENSEDSVSHFDDRLKRAQAKFKIIDRHLGDSGPELSRSTNGTPAEQAMHHYAPHDRGDGEGNIEDMQALNARR
ncbi:MAG: hypothetical protein M1838_006102 [Thelocarpon superellum]|nr:MAG: hypothetical protein M1838_006102 [Thelocarpon superellum]